MKSRTSLTAYACANDKKDITIKNQNTDMENVRYLISLVKGDKSKYDMLLQCIDDNIGRDLYGLFISDAESWFGVSDNFEEVLTKLSGQFPGLLVEVYSISNNSGSVKRTRFMGRRNEQAVYKFPGYVNLTDESWEKSAKGSKKYTFRYRWYGYGDIEVTAENRVDAQKKANEIYNIGDFDQEGWRTIGSKLIREE